ncbi:MAG: CocE/NonD family hydrolase [Sphingomonadales bacterium]|nr:CocE/NonD family hydrolase [Sphingomonadales bacterium]
MQRILLLSLIFLSVSLYAQSINQDSLYMRTHYTKAEYRVRMRDGVHLFLLVYTPKDTTKKYPVLLNRTCYNASSYGDFNTYNHPSRYLVQQGYILAFQDVRGRYMSEGVFNNMTPNIPGNDPRNKKDIDESSDTWDTIDWMTRNLPRNNGRVGIYGISYPGFYSAASLPDAHPALKAVSPQAPISDFFFDDFHHMGAYLQSYTAAFAVFGYQKTDTTREDWYAPQLMRFYEKPVADGYDFHLQQGPLSSFTEKYHHDNFFWQQINDHPNYDSFWQKRSLLPHLTNIKPAVLTVGGWFDAEDLYGPLNIYKKIEQSTPGAKNAIVMGPWGHGDWSRDNPRSIHNNLYFGDSIAYFFQRDVEARFFAFHLKDEKDPALPEALMYNTGTKKWERFAQWPPADIAPVQLYFGEQGQLSINKPLRSDAQFRYVSDPAKPVPYTSQTEGLTFTPRNFMSDDQREASRRPDVLTFSTPVLQDDLTLAGEILAKLKVILSTTDADFIVKLIDVYPNDHPDYPHNPPTVKMGGYQQLVRHEVFRGRFRNSFEKPEPFVPGEPTDLQIPLQDILHTFKKGHRVMIQIHSTWFPYIDRNPQQYVENIYKAKATDFISAEIKVLGSSSVTVGGAASSTKKGF